MNDKFFLDMFAVLFRKLKSLCIFHSFKQELEENKDYNRKILTRTRYSKCTKCGKVKDKSTYELTYNDVYATGIATLCASQKGPMGGSNCGYVVASGEGSHAYGYTNVGTIVSGDRKKDMVRFTKDFVGIEKL